MSKASAAIFATTLLASTMWALPAQAQNKTYYVDYQFGNDSADGLSPATAWKHAPGDDKAPARILRLELQPGDQVRFRGGIRYRGSLTPRTNGTPDNPVVFDGSSWGPMRAIFDGSNPLTDIRRCQSAADCLGNPNWAQLWRASLPADRSWTDHLFINDEIYQVAQYPELSRADSDDPGKFLQIPLSELSRLQSGQIRHALPANFDRGEPALALWVNPNRIAFNQTVSVSTNGVTFDPNGSWVNSGFDPYTNKNSAFSLVNLPAMVTRPGLFAASRKDGILIFWPKVQLSSAGRGGTGAMPQASIGGRRLGINTSKAENVVIRGFSFTSYSGEPKNMSQGTAILARGKLSGITIAHNSFRSITNLSGPAVLHMIFARNLTIEHNEIDQAPWVSGMIIDNAEGPVTIRCNSVRQVGRTGISLRNVKDGSVLGNQLTQINGVHGNGMSFYLDNRQILVAGNVVTDSIRPLTVKGKGNGASFHSDGVESITITDNVLIGNNGVNGAITSYNDTPNLSITNNFLYSNPYALKITGRETGFVATGNQLVGGVVQPKDNKIFDAGSNVSHDAQGNGASLVQQMSRSTPPAQYCS